MHNTPATTSSAPRTRPGVTGVSLNLALPHTAGSLTHAGFQVVVPRDAVGGTPASYAEQVLTHTMALLGTITTVDELVA